MEMSLRQYAKKIGCSHQTVSSAIGNGEIFEGFNKKTNKIIPEVADVEWGIEFMKRNANKKLVGKVKPKPSVDEDGEDWDMNVNDVEIGDRTQYPELQRLELLYKARLGKLKVEKEAGLLVNKDDVYRELFDYGKNVRTRLQSIPDRIIDDLMACDDRDKAKELLFNEIMDALEELSKLETAE